jgi:hypothetical protein
LSPADALSLVTEAAERLWKPEGAPALAYLHDRCLDDERIKAARLGWTPRAAGVPWKPPGVVIPAFEGNRLSLVKIRPPEEWRERFPEDNRPPKYIQAFRDRLRIFPDPAIIKPGRPLIIVEGEFDALLLGQELRGLAVVVTLGSASSRPDPDILLELMPAAPWFLALDGDEAGDKAATDWPAAARRVLPPEPFKDWTEAAQAGVNLRCWWLPRLGGREALWDELSTWRWGPALNDGPVEDEDSYAAEERRCLQIVD